MRDNLIFCPILKEKAKDKNFQETENCLSIKLWVVVQKVVMEYLSD